MSNVSHSSISSFPDVVYTVCSLSESLYLQMPTLPTASHKNESVLMLSTGTGLNHEEETVFPTTSKWVDEEERKFFEDTPDLRDCVPKGVLAPETADKTGAPAPVTVVAEPGKPEQLSKEAEDAEIRQLRSELESLSSANKVETVSNGTADEYEDE